MSNFVLIFFLQEKKEKRSQSGKIVQQQQRSIRRANIRGRAVPSKVIECIACLPLSEMGIFKYLNIETKLEKMREVDLGTVYTDMYQH